jgi:hypothetical protein
MFSVNPTVEQSLIFALPEPKKDPKLKVVSIVTEQLIASQFWISIGVAKPTKKETREMGSVDELLSSQFIILKFLTVPPDDFEIRPKSSEFACIFKFKIDLKFPSRVPEKLDVSFPRECSFVNNPSELQSFGKKKIFR